MTKASPKLPDLRVLGSYRTIRDKTSRTLDLGHTTRYGIVRLRVMTLMNSPLRPVGRGSLQAMRSQ